MGGWEMRQFMGKCFEYLRVSNYVTKSTTLRCTQFCEATIRVIWDLFWKSTKDCERNNQRLTILLRGDQSKQKTSDFDRCINIDEILK